MTRRLAGTGFWILLALLVIANAIVMWHSLTVLRFWEDEAFNLTVPRNLLAGLGYTSDGTLSGSHLTPFDPRISTGPTVLLPVAGVLALGADPVIGARLVPLAYWVLLLVGLAVLGRRLAGRWGALVAVALPLAFNTAEGVSPIQGPADLLGEIAAAALVVWAMIVLPRRAWLAGLLLGLAVQAKLIALLALPAFAVALFLLAPRGRFGPSLLATLRRSIVPLVMVAVPTLLMELAALVTLGFSGYEVHARLMKEFVLSGGQKGAPTTIGEKLQTLAGSWFLPWWLVSVAAVLAVVVIVLAARRGRGADPEHAAEASARSDSADADPTAVRDAASAPTAAALDTAALDTAGGDRGPVRGADPRDAASASAPAGLGTDTEGGDRGPVRGADPRDAASASAPAGLGTDT
ncbi:MAG: hypothetical protein JSS74_11190, partial [Actinobacteria bacterium]|nr:hypothetical protein [Actinomycetota bacterium]